MHMAGRGGRPRAHPRAGGRVALPVVGALFESSAGAVGILGRVVEVIGGCPLVVVDDVARRLFERVSSACVTWVLLPRWWSSTSAGAGCAWSRSCWTSGGCSRFPRARGRGGRARRWRVSTTRGWLLLLPILGPVEVVSAGVVDSPALAVGILGCVGRPIRVCVVGPDLPACVVSSACGGLPGAGAGAETRERLAWRSGPHGG
jgi:hypothetical protein